VRGLPEAIPHSRTSYWPVTLGDCAYILDKRVAQGALVRRGYVLSWREDCEAKGDKKEGGKDTPNVYLAPVSPGPYDAC
jgi:hypothetical protein